MPKGLKRLVRDHLEKARAAALAAVEAYNKPGSHFRKYEAVTGKKPPQAAQQTEQEG